MPHRLRHLRHISKAPQFAKTLDRSKPVLRFLDFAQQCHEHASALAADVYVAHGVEALPAADAVARANGGRLVCDAIEIPSFADRAGVYDWHPASKRFLDLGFDAYLRQCDRVLTVSWALRDQLPVPAARVTVIPNYRYGEAFEASSWLRQRCGVGDDDFLLLSLSTVTSGLDSVLEALARLPAHVHLAVVGRIVPASYHDAIGRKIAELGLADRVHLLDPVPYAKLSSAICGANLGLIVRDPRIPNNYISLPNRVFDLIDAGVPFCTPEIPDIAWVARHYGVGAVVPEMGAEAWAAAIDGMRQQAAEMRPNCAKARGELTWNSLIGCLLDSLERPRTVTFFGISDLGKNNRTLRIARTLRDTQCRVTLCSGTQIGRPAIVTLDS